MSFGGRWDTQAGVGRVGGKVEGPSDKADTLAEIRSGVGASAAPGEASRGYSIRCLRGQNRREGKREL